MSTQHPDNVAMPFFASGAPLTAEDEVREAYYAFSHLGCDEQMWDFEGKEVDGHIVQKLLATYESFFAEHPIGESVHLTPRIPNPALEPTQAKIVLEVLQSLPRHADIARVFYDRERPPILELIHPMTTSARELDRVREYYERFVAGMEQVTLGTDERPLGAWFGRFSPPTVRMIPLIEDREHLLAADDLVREYLCGKELEHMRVFIARSDPALNYGYLSAVLLALVALERRRARRAASSTAEAPRRSLRLQPRECRRQPAARDPLLREPLLARVAARGRRARRADRRGLVVAACDGPLARERARRRDALSRPRRDRVAAAAGARKHRARALAYRCSRRRQRALRDHPRSAARRGIERRSDDRADRPRRRAPPLSRIAEGSFFPMRKGHYEWRLHARRASPKLR